MASLKFSVTASVVAGGFNLTPPKGFRWKVRGVHVQVNSGAGAGTRRVVCFISNDPAGPDGILLADTGAFVTANSNAHGEGGGSTQGFFVATAGATEYIPWSADTICESTAQIQVTPTLVAGDNYTFKISIEEEVA